jgi:PPOX class probable F420-dependent enzyme
MKRKVSAVSSLPASRALKRLATEAYINLGTFRRNGKAVETPVWFAILGGKLYVVTDGTSAKVKRIRATKRVRLAPCTVWGGVTGDWIDGTGRILAEQRHIGRAHAALEKKYGWQMWLLDAMSRMVGRIGRRAYIELSVGDEAEAAE